MPECSVSEVCLTFSSPQTDPGFLTFLTPWTDPGIKPMCLTPPALAGGFFTTGDTREALICLWLVCKHAGSSVLVAVFRIFSCAVWTLPCSLWEFINSSLTRDRTLHWEPRALAIGPPGKSLDSLEEGVGVCDLARKQRRKGTPARG